MKCWLPILVFVTSAAVGVPPEIATGASRAERAASLFTSACGRLARGGHEQRRFALGELQEACALDPTRSDIPLALGRLYLESDLRHEAKRVAQRLTAADSASAEAWLLEGEVWRRYWLATVDDSQRDRSIVCLARSAHLAPRRSKAWTLLAPLLVDADELEAARDVAILAVRSAPADAEAQVLLAAASQRVGDLVTAERLFRSAVPRLPDAVRERYDDIAPLLPPWQAESYQALPAPQRERFAERFWTDSDPDPVSGENEARLEYWARVTQAAFLYGTSRTGEWDMRAQYYVRFGRPGLQELQPIYKPGALRAGDWLAWTYPELGMRVWMGGSSLSLGFPEVVSGRPLMVRASPDSLAGHGELAPLNRGWAVFHRLPPGMTFLDTRLALARFQAGTEASLFAQVEAPGGLADHVVAEWVVLDSTNTPVAREGHAMSASACRPEQGRAASFTATLPAGRYSLGVQVSDNEGRRGAIRRPLYASPATDSLAISDLVITCSQPDRSVVPGSAVRLEPETGLFPAGGDQLHAYFEIYNLGRGAGGEARFAYDCVVRSAAHDGRAWLTRMLQPRESPPEIHVSRVEATQGSLRRQFLSVPVGSLPAGRYEIEVRVRDVSNGAETQAVAAFERQP